MRKIKILIMSVCIFGLVWSIKGAKAEYTEVKNDSINTGIVSKGSSVGSPSCISGMVDVTNVPSYFGGVVTKSENTECKVHYLSGIGKAEYYNTTMQARIVEEYVDISDEKRVMVSSEKMAATSLQSKALVLNQGTMVRVKYLLDPLNDTYDDMPWDPAYITVYFY